MVAQFQTKNPGDFGLDKFDGTVVTAETLIAALTSVPFLATSRLVIVDDLSQNKPVAEKVLNVAKSIPDTTIAVFYESKVDKRSKFFKDMKKTAKAVEFNKMEPTPAKRLARKTSKRTRG